MSSKIVDDSHGRKVVVVTTSTTPELPVGTRFVIVGNDFPVAEPGIRWLGHQRGVNTKPRTTGEGDP